MTEEIFIEVSGLHKILGSQKILRGVDLEIRRGETMVVIGRSGEGKSVFLKHLIGLMTPDRGSIRFDGEEIVGLHERQLNPVRQKVGVLFQEGALFDSMTVSENVAFPLRERGTRKRKILIRKVKEALKMVELEEHGEKMPVNLSGGMRKRVALARAIITKPQCILYDEPTSGLDPVVADSIDHLIRRLRKELGVTSIVVTHDMKSVFKIASRVAYLREGKIYFLGTTDDLKNSSDPAIRNFIEGNSEESLREANGAAAKLNGGDDDLAPGRKGN